LDLLLDKGWLFAFHGVFVHLKSKLGQSAYGADNGTTVAVLDESVTEDEGEHVIFLRGKGLIDWDSFVVFLMWSVEQFLIQLDVIAVATHVSQNAIGWDSHAPFDLDQIADYYFRTEYLLPFRPIPFSLHFHFRMLWLSKRFSTLLPPTILQKDLKQVEYPKHEEKASLSFE